MAERIVVTDRLVFVLFLDNSMHSRILLPKRFIVIIVVQRLIFRVEVDLLETSVVELHIPRFSPRDVTRVQIEVLSLWHLLVSGEGRVKVFEFWVVVVNVILIVVDFLSLVCKLFFLGLVVQICFPFSLEPWDCVYVHLALRWYVVVQWAPNSGVDLMRLYVIVFLLSMVVHWWSSQVALKL